MGSNRLLFLVAPSSVPLSLVRGTISGYTTVLGGESPWPWRASIILGLTSIFCQVSSL